MSLVQILPYNCLESDQSFFEDSPPSSTRMLVSPSDPFSPPSTIFAPPPLLPFIANEDFRSWTNCLLNLAGAWSVVITAVVMQAVT